MVTSISCDVSRVVSTLPLRLSYEAKFNWRYFTSYKDLQQKPRGRARCVVGHEALHLKCWHGQVGKLDVGRH